MFFDEILDIQKIAEQENCAVFVLPKNTEISIKNAIVLKPEEKATITISQVQDIIKSLAVRQDDVVNVLIRSADLMGDEAANAILKTLEEPQENVHFLLMTDEPAKLLSTILSRAAVYVWKGGLSSIKEIQADEKTKTIAKRLLAAKPADLVDIAEEITKQKDGVRGRALDILGVAIEMAYKSYFITKKDVFLGKIPKLIRAYECISGNGHIKLHLVADLV